MQQTTLIHCRVTHRQRYLVALLLLSACKSASGPAGDAQVKVAGGEAVSSSSDKRSEASTIRLELATPTYDQTAVCTGTLIGPHHIVTAAHCLADTNMNIVGIGGGASDDPYSKFPSVEITAVTPHPKWKKPNLLYDIGVISFSGDLPASMHPVSIGDIKGLKVNDDVLIAGFGFQGEKKWGRTLNQAKVKVLSLDLASRALNIAQGTGVGGCHGDSGGPVYIDDGKKLRVIGATHGQGMGMENVPCDSGHGSYSIVSLYQGWMKCAFSSHHNPLDALLNDASQQECPSGAAKKR